MILKLEESNAEVKRLHEELMNTRSIVECLNQDIQEYDEENQGIEQQAYEKESKVENQRREIKKFQQQQILMKSEIKSFNEELSNSRKQVQSLEAQIQEFQVNHQLKENLIQRLKEALVKYRKQEDLQNKNSKQDQVNMNQLLNYQNVSQYQNQVQDLKSQLDESNKKQQELSEELAKIKQDNERLISNMKQKRGKGELNYSQLQMKEAIEQRNKCQVENQNLKQEIETFKQKNDHLNQISCDIAQKYAQNNSLIERQKGIIESQQKEINDLRNIIEKQNEQILNIREEQNQQNIVRQKDENEKEEQYEEVQIQEIEMNSEMQQEYQRERQKEEKLNSSSYQKEEKEKSRFQQPEIEDQSQKQDNLKISVQRKDQYSSVQSSCQNPLNAQCQISSSSNISSIKFDPCQQQSFFTDHQVQQIQPRRKLESLMDEYYYNQNIKGNVKNLMKKYNSYRAIRGDGNSYYRAIGFAFLEHLIRVTTPIGYLQEFIYKINRNFGYYQVRPNNKNDSHEVLRKTFLQLLRNLEQQKMKNNLYLTKYLTEEIQSNKDNQDEALVWEMRCITANYLEQHQNHFESFNSVSYNQLIKNILTMGKEPQGIEIGPLQIVLRIKIESVTIEGGKEESIFDQIKVAGLCPLIYILQKPGHFDIIYTKEQSNADGFDESNQIYFQSKIPKGYNTQNPGEPFFIYITESGNEYPLDESKLLQAQHDIFYISTTENQKQEQDPNLLSAQLEKCQKCLLEIELECVIELQCSHKVCKWCLEDEIQQDQNECKQIAKCTQCAYILTNIEIEKIVEKKELENEFKSTAR